jgi:hypothetical protein
MNVFLNNIGIAKETEKAYLLVFGTEKTAWVPKSVIYITDVQATNSYYLVWNVTKYNPQTGGMVAKKINYSKKCNIEMVGNFYKNNKVI